MIPFWIIIAIGIFVVVVFLFRTVNHFYVFSLFKKNFFWFFFIALLLFASFSIYHLHTTYDLDLSTKEGFMQAMNVYYGWLANVFKNMGRVTGYAVQQDWFTSTSNSTIK